MLSMKAGLHIKGWKVAWQKGFKDSPSREEGGACGWSVVQLDHDEEMEAMRGICGTLDAELEVQRTIKRVGLTAFFCLLRRIIGPTTAHVDNKGTIAGLWRGEMQCIAPN